MLPLSTVLCTSCNYIDMCCLLQIISIHKALVGILAKTRYVPVLQVKSYFRELEKTESRGNANQVLQSLRHVRGITETCRKDGEI